MGQKHEWLPLFFLRNKKILLIIYSFYKLSQINLGGNPLACYQDHLWTAGLVFKCGIIAFNLIHFIWCICVGPTGDTDDTAAETAETTKHVPPAELEPPQALSLFSQRVLFLKKISDNQPKLTTAWRPSSEYNKSSNSSMFLLVKHATGPSYMTIKSRSLSDYGDYSSKCVNSTMWYSWLDISTLRSSKYFSAVFTDPHFYINTAYIVSSDVKKKCKGKGNFKSFFISCLNAKRMSSILIRFRAHLPVEPMPILSSSTRTREHSTVTNTIS